MAASLITPSPAVAASFDPTVASPTRARGLVAAAVDRWRRELAGQSADSAEPDAGHDPVPTAATRQPTAIGRPLPSFWPPLQLPRADAVLLDVPRSSASAVQAVGVAEEEAWRLRAPEAGLAATRTPTKKRRLGAAAQRLSTEQRQLANERGELCKCGKLDVDKFMVQCDSCDVWFHGDCVGIRQDRAARARAWRCRACARKHDSACARAQRYCVCRGPWDGRSFMIACDACDGWFHGACVAYRVDSLQRGTEAAFRRYHCARACSGGEEG
jgi:hypothetical protein